MKHAFSIHMKQRYEAWVRAVLNNADEHCLLCILFTR